MNKVLNIKPIDNYKQHTHLLKEGDLVCVYLNEIYNWGKITGKILSPHLWLIITNPIKANHKGYGSFKVGDKLYLSNINVSVILKGPHIEVMKEHMLTQYV